jgi:hypothetical protein
VAPTGFRFFRNEEQSQKRRGEQPAIHLRASQDFLSGGAVFNSSLMWDGTHGLVNRPSVPITTYANDGGWSDVFFLFGGGVSSLGFSYGQADANIVIGLDLGSGFAFFKNSTDLLSTISPRSLHRSQPVLRLVAVGTLK